ncbi:MAG: hypothetical protein FWE17_00305 [Alphaproteobacteria bacterium]|nr:hypothetical protein [Alphaproteobacteria bacterium]MCL2757748.1 hypothetical protein [Alphaproteobacteria bacterium]
MRQFLIIAGIIAVFAGGIYLGQSGRLDNLSGFIKRTAATEAAAPEVPAAPVMVEPQRLPDRTCEAIEVQLLNRIVPEDEINSQDNFASEMFMHNSRIYSDLMRVGCPENSERFRDLARRQLDIASALLGEIRLDDGGHIQEEHRHIRRMRIAREVQEETEFVREARRIMERASRLGEPALWFIGEIERVFME